MDRTRVFQNLDEGAIGLTPNLRLNQNWQLAFAAWQRDVLKRRVWKAPDILPVTAWIQRLWLEASQTQDLPVVLTEAQELWLWTNIIEDSMADTPLIHPLATAAQVQQAWNLIQQWELPWDRPDFPETPDQEQLQRWAKRFCERCEQAKVIEPARQLRILLERGLIAKTRSVLRLNIIDATPLQERLWSSLDVLDYQPPSASSQNYFREYENQDEEFAAMIAWACEQRREGATRVACVIPDLQVQKPRLRRLFDRASRGEFPVNISLGDPLSQNPIIETALRALDLQRSILSVTELSILLRSPFLGESERELGDRSRLDAKILGMERAEISRSEFLSLARVFAPRLAERWENVEAAGRESRSPHEWAKHVITALEQLGWPGERILSSEEYQQVERFQALLMEFSQLERVVATLKWPRALDALRRMAQRTLFQAQSIPGTVIHVLGLLEAVSLPFDAIWLASSDDRYWPGPASPTPYIPYSWQRKCDLPHATAEKEWRFSLKLLEEFQRHTPLLIASMAKQVEDAQSRASRFMRDFQQEYAEPAALFSLPDPISLETLSDAQGPAITESHIRGGSYILKEQAACPFRAYARGRLRAESLGTQTLGISAIQRGLLVHAALEQFWSWVRDSRTLLELSHEQEQQILQTIIKKVTRSLPEADQSIETARLLRLLTRWLRIERERPPFRVIGTEVSVEFEMDGKSLQVRMDRIDECEDGSKLVIDYKTGYTQIIDWFEDPPQEPQLPLYALTDPAIQGLAYAQVRADDSVFHGVGAGLAEIEKWSDGLSWDQQRERWSLQLRALMQEYVNGVARVQPHSATTCQYCDCAPFCRIEEKFV